MRWTNFGAASAPLRDRDRVGRPGGQDLVSGAVCKPSRKLRRFESSTRHKQQVWPLTSMYAVRGRSCRSGWVRPSTTVHGNIAGTPIVVLSLVSARHPVAVDPPIGERARPRCRHHETGVRHGNHAGGAGGGSARLARVGGSGGHPGAGAPPPEVSLVGTRRWKRAQRAVRREPRRMTTTDARHQRLILSRAPSAWQTSLRLLRVGAAAPADAGACAASRPSAAGVVDWRRSPGSRRRS